MDKLIKQQKRELVILNAIIETLSSSYNLRETLEAALEMVLSVTDASTGWICLLGDNNTCSSFVGYKGLCISDGAGKPPTCLAACVCSRVRQTGEVVIIRDLAEYCPLLEIPDQTGRRITGHVSVPLMAKSRIVGQLNVSLNHPQQADEMDIDLLKTVGPHLAVAIENARLCEQVQEKEELRKELLKKVVTAQEEERRRISRELHDVFGQEMTSLLVRLQVLENMEHTANSQAQELITGLLGSVSQLLTSVHDLSLELRPMALDDLGLGPALAQYVKTCPANLGIEVDFEEIQVSGHRLPREVETTLYRIIQEALTNVARHSQAKSASVLLKKNGKSITAIIEDNGIGFSPDEVKTGQARNHRLGIYGMEERVALVGGKVTIESKPGAGTAVYVEIPLEEKM